MKVLIVSGLAAQREWVRGALGPAWKMEETTNGRDALRIVEEDDEIDLVVTDETTEPFGGLGLSREVKLLIDPPAIIVLLERSQDQWLARWSGADRWLVRPIDAFELADIAAALVRPAPAARRRP